MILRVAEIHSFSLIYNVPSYIATPQFIRSILSGYLGCFQFVSLGYNLNHPPFVTVVLGHVLLMAPFPLLLGPYCFIFSQFCLIENNLGAFMHISSVSCYK